MCYITLHWGPHQTILAVGSKVPSAFLLICFTTHRCLGAEQRERWAVCHKCVWSEIREGKDTKAAPVAAAVFEVQGMLDNCCLLIGWRGHAWVCPGSAMLPLCDEKSDNSSETGCPIGRQDPWGR
ncbi:hypothetical protein NL108_000680 [Boleophthalmus pectinirostris]|nr:hypothetical protein NL108_000680 [Boleophthalmus pectinirostris]